MKEIKKRINLKKKRKIAKILFLMYYEMIWGN